MKEVEPFEKAMPEQTAGIKDWCISGLRKQRGKNHWTLPYAYAGRQSEVHIWLVEDKDSAYFGKYQVYCGTVSEVADTLEEAAELARGFTSGGAL